MTDEMKLADELEKSWPLHYLSDKKRGMILAALRSTAPQALAATPAMRDALGEIASKNDLSGISDDDLASAACNALYECELIARAALAATPAVGGEAVWWRWRFQAEGRWSKWIALNVDEVDAFRELQGHHLESGHCELQPLFAAPPAQPEYFSDCQLRGPGECQSRGMCLSDACKHTGKAIVKRVCVEPQVDGILYPKVES